MKYRIASFLFAFLLISAFSAHIGYAQALTPPTERTPKKFSMVPYLASGSCRPVEVKAVSNAAQPPEVLTSLVTIKSLSDKPITAVKLGWDIYDWDAGNRKRNAACDAEPESAEVYLSGTTALIDVGRLLKGEVYNISSNPDQKTSPFRASKTIIVERPIIAWDDVKSLTTEGTRETFKDDYLGVVYVVEIHFADGTKWEAEKK